MPSQEEVEFYLLSEDTEQPSSTDHIFHDDVTNESKIEIIATENIEKSFETCLVNNFKGNEEEVDFDLLEDIECSSFTDHVVQIDDTDESIREPLRTKNKFESFDTCSISNETCELDNLKFGEEEVIFYLSEDTKCHSFTDPTFQVVNFYYTSNVL